MSHSDQSNDTSTTQTIMVDSTDFKRLETKVDDLTNAMTKLILVEERQTNQGARIGALETANAVLATRIENADRKVDKWINRGIGVWGFAIAVWTVFTQYHPK